MNPQAAFRRKIAYLVAIAVLLWLLYLLGSPATSGTAKREGSPGGYLAQMREAHELSQAQLGDIDPTSETIKLALLGLRGVAADVLWIKANQYKMKKDWTNLSATLEQITKVQPNFASVWQNQGWNLSYNVSVEFDDFRERYRWVIKGINFLKRGVEYNRRDPELLWYIGFVISHKMGRSDERKQFRRLFKDDIDFNDGVPQDKRDSWLVAKEWFLKSIDLVDNEKVRTRSMSPLVFRSEAPRSQMNYADGLEVDGIFGEKARMAWAQAAKEWHDFGDFEVPFLNQVMVQLNQQEEYEAQIKKLAAQIDELAPGTREKLLAEKRSRLSDEQRQALDTPQAKRTAQQQAVADDAATRVQITENDVARQIKSGDPKRVKALELARQAAEAHRMVAIISRYREIVNFGYWRLRAQVEQDDLTLNARKFLYQADQALSDADLMRAKSNYEEGLRGWRMVLDKYPQMVLEATTGRDLLEVIEKYREFLAQNDEPFPKPFVLQDILDLYEEKRE